MESDSRIVLGTQDGSDTISIPSLGITYHSIYGAVRESEHVFIQMGLYKALDVFKDTELRILEMGFGTGLNALLTAREAELLRRHFHYSSVELHPLSLDIINGLNYGTLVGFGSLFVAIHEAAWNSVTPIGDYFSLNKLMGDLVSLPLEQGYHLIYYDAFAPNAQPELWTEEVFGKLWDSLVMGGILVTYCSKGSVRRALKAVGFKVEKLPGPPGKWEIVRAIKSYNDIVIK